MPIMITTPYGNVDNREAIEFGKLRSKYREFYPPNVDLTPGTEVHDRLARHILELSFESERFMSQKFRQWNLIDDMLTGYIPTSDYEKKLENADPNTPISIVVPESYSTLETLLTYMMAAYSESPMFEYEGMGPEDLIGSILMEKVVEVQTRRSKALLALHTQWRDAFTYGIGIVAVAWTTKSGKRPVLNDLGLYDPSSGAFIKTGTEKVIEDYVYFEGSQIYNISPYYYLPDPNTELYNPQGGDRVGWLEEDTLLSLKRSEAEQGSMYFNVGYLEGRATTSALYTTGHGAINRGITGRDSSGGYSATQAVDKIWMHEWIIPSEWNLGSTNEPVLYLFCLAGDGIIIACHSLDLYHNMFPVAVCAPDYGGHEIMPISRLETMYGLQKGMNFWYNSKVENIRQMLWMAFLVDPKSVNMHDVINRNRFIRTRRPVWGRGIKDIMEQLQVSNITQDFTQEMLMSREMSRNVTGATDALQGLQRTKGERVTKAEFQSTMGSALSRLQKSAQLISLQSMYDIALMYAMNTQQFMSEDTYVKTLGRWEETLRGEYGITDPTIKVRPSDLNVLFDIKIKDGSVDSSEFTDNWIQLLQIMMQNPETLQTFDYTRLILHVARMMKAKNAEEFLKKGPPVGVQEQSTEQIQQGVQAGNLVSLNEAV